jgi:hypothetical protein
LLKEDDQDQHGVTKVEESRKEATDETSLRFASDLQAVSMGEEQASRQRWAAHSRWGGGAMRTVMWGDDEASGEGKIN